ncbi:MAG TPA: glutamate-1-semialdehyde-2,1-aminomutase [Spirochaetia bacterium]|nr:glutamate-1-semialdehyde-2,1-aminomutase [Spirochaetia bacterium]
MVKSAETFSDTSSGLFDRARAVIPGGVNSPVRAFGSVGGTPIYVRRGFGSKIETVEGRHLTDFCCSWGPLILGHAYPEIVRAVSETAGSGLSFGINHPDEVRLAELLCRAFPSMEQVRLVNSGTEATMTALRLARGFTGRDKILKFEGCYHGHSDSLLINAGSGILTAGIAGSKGVPAATAKDTLVAPWNNLSAVQQITDAYKNEIAAIIAEPVAGNMGLVLPEPGFLEGLRACCNKIGAVLIFDEVITGFRFTWGGYQSICGVQPDITCLGKIIGGGMPIGAVGGCRKILECLSPLGGVYQAGTLSGNPVAVKAGITTLEILARINPYAELAGLVSEAAERISRAGGNRICVSRFGSAFTVFFSRGPVTDLASAKKSDTQRYGKFFHAMLDSGFYLPPAQFETAFISAVHTFSELDSFARAAEIWFSAE